MAVYITSGAGAGAAASSTSYLNILILHDQFMLMKLVLNLASMKFHQQVYTFSLFQQLPYFEPSNRRAYTLQAFAQAKDFAGNELMLLFDQSNKVASIFSLDHAHGQKQVVPYREAVLGDGSLIKAIPSMAAACQLLLLTDQQVVLHQTEIAEEAAKFRTLYIARDGEHLIDLMSSQMNTVEPNKPPQLIILTNQQVILLDALQYKHVKLHEKASLSGAQIMRVTSTDAIVRDPLYGFQVL